MPKLPERETPPKEWEHYELWERVKETLGALPKHFESTVTVGGVKATEIYTFGAALGATIEEEVVRTMNELRELWDPKGKYGSFGFVRQSEIFPDVLMRNLTTGEIILGLELKSWYLLAKEGEPSFRFTVTSDSCAQQDLVVVVPWVLTNVLAGSPEVLSPFVESARFVAKYRNYWWQHLREAKGDSGIKSPKEARPYPKGREEIADAPLDDRGKNFGRIARIGLMDDYVRSFDDMPLLGIKLCYWRQFFKSGGERYTEACNSKLEML